MIIGYGKHSLSQGVLYPAVSALGIGKVPTAHLPDLSCLRQLWGLIPHLPLTHWASLGLQAAGHGRSPTPSVGVVAGLTPFGASLEPGTAVQGQRRRQKGLPQMLSGPASQRPSSTVAFVWFPHLAPSDSDGAAAQVGDRAPSEQDPAPCQAPRPLRVPGGGRPVVGGHAGATPGVPQGADADRQDPGPDGQRALGVHRAQEEVGPQQAAASAVRAVVGGEKIRKWVREVYTQKGCAGSGGL